MYVQYMNSQLPHRIVFGLAWPMIISNISVPLLGIVDTAILGHLDSAKYLAGVAAGATILSFLLWLFGFLRMGTTGLTAQALGRKCESDILRLLLQGLLIGWLLGLFLFLAKPLLLPFALHWIKPTEMTAELALSYCEIRLLSAPFVLANYTLVGWFIGLQNTRAAMTIMVMANVLNVILDWLFIIVLDLRSDGAAYATVIADISSFLIGIFLAFRITKKYSINISVKLISNYATYIELFQVNHQLFIRTACLLFVLSFFTAQGARMGDIVLASNAILMQLLLLTSHGLDGFAHAAEALTGKFIGERKFSEYMAVCKSSTLWSVWVALAFTVSFYFFKTPIIQLFSDIPAIKESVTTYYSWLYLLPLISVWSYLFDGIFIGTGKTAAMKNTMLIACFMVFIPVWWLTLRWDNHGLWFSFICFNGARGLIQGWIFLKYIQQKNGVYLFEK